MISRAILTSKKGGNWLHLPIDSTFEETMKVRSSERAHFASMVVGSWGNQIICNDESSLS
jgi:hypothetical protein